MKRQMLLTLTLSILAANAFAAPVTHQDLSSQLKTSAASISHTYSVAQDGADRQLNSVAQDGADRQLNSVAQDGADRSLNTVAQDGADRNLTQVS
jgi:hypothetical protein